MPKVEHFNPWIRLADKASLVTPLTSWWAEPLSQADWYIRARGEITRMNASPEALTIQPKCLDDIK